MYAIIDALTVQV